MSENTDRRSRFPWLVPAAVVVASAVLIAIVVGLDGGTGSSADGSGPAASAGAGGPPQPEYFEAERRDKADLLAAGPVDAPVVLIAFSDYQCPFCARWSAETLPVMMEKADAGELRIEWRDVNVFGPASERAARASYAAAAQGAFWDYHDALFADGGHRTEAQLSDEALVALAADNGLDVERFSADLASADTAAQIATNQQLGFELGATSTPVFILGGQPIVGAQPTEVFLDAFETALAAAE